MSEKDPTSPASKDLPLFKRLTLFEGVSRQLTPAKTGDSSSIIETASWHGRCTTLERRVSVDWKRPFRQLWHVCERTPPFVMAFFSRRGILSSNGRTLLRGKTRRIFISFIPPLARYLQKKNGLTGGCVSCGASCKLLFQCPHWDDKSHLCSVYNDRPNICRFFPITPQDIKDRDLVLKDKTCGFTFTGTDKK